LRMLGHLFHLVIDNTEHLDDNVYGCHEALRSSGRLIFYPLGRSS
jgi:hypothetical protein